MESAQKQIEDRHDDMYAARRTAYNLINWLDRFIPDACKRDALEHIIDICFEEGLELTSKAMRKEYEAWKLTQVDLPGMKPNG